MKYQKVLAIISFILVMLAFTTALISDFVIFKDAILTFFGAIIASVFVFIILIIAMLASIILIFGVYLLKENGFWPLDLTIDAFKSIINDIVITQEQISSFVSFRIALLVICIVSLVLSIVARVRNEEKKKVPFKGMSIVTTVFSILGIISAVSLLTIALNIL